MSNEQGQRINLKEPKRVGIAGENVTEEDIPALCHRCNEISAVFENNRTRGFVSAFAPDSWRSELPRGRHSVQAGSSNRRMSQSHRGVCRGGRV